MTRADIDQWVCESRAERALHDYITALHDKLDKVMQIASNAVDPRLGLTEILAEIKEEAE